MSPVREINVFISSDMTELEYDREIAQEALKDINVNPILFEVFPALSESPCESYREEVRNCDIFLMLLWKSFRKSVQEEYAEAIRLNKPILILVKSLIGNEQRKQKLKSFLTKLSSDSQKLLTKRVTYKDYRKVNELRTAIKESVVTEIAKFYKEPIYTMARDEMYELGTSITRYAQRRLYLYQRTPSIILGPRDYMNDSKKYAYEKEFADVLEAWIHNNYKLPDKEFLYLFSPDATKQEILDERLAENKKYVEIVKKNVKRLKNIEAESGRRFRISAIDVPISGPLIVGDNRYGIWVLGGDRAVSISQENNKICDILVRIFNSYSQENLSYENILSMVGL